MVGCEPFILKLAFRDYIMHIKRRRKPTTPVSFSSILETYILCAISITEIDL